MKTPPALFSPVPGVEINPEALTVKVSPEAFAAWPWSGLSWPCKGEMRGNFVFSFEGSPPPAGVSFPFAADHHPYQLIGIEWTDLLENGEADISPEAETALVSDCAALLACFDCFPNDGDAEKILKALYGMEMPPEVLKAAREEGERAGKNAAEWIAQDSFGGRSKGGREARETAKRVLRMIDDGDPALALHEIEPPGDWITGDLFAVQTLGFVYSQRFDRFRDLLETLSLKETLEEWGREIDETRDQGFREALEWQLADLAAAAAGKGESK